MSGDNTQPTYSRYQFDFYTITFEGNSVSCILYGVYLVIAAKNLYLLHKKKYKRYKVLSWFTVVQLILTALYFILSLYAGPGQALSIFHIGDSFGPNALSPWPIVIVDTAFVVNTWASDGFLIYRCYVVCMGNMYALVVPMFLYLAAFGASIALLVVSSLPSAMYSSYAVQLTGICYWSCSAALNVCASFLICTRLWLHRRTMMNVIDSEFERDSFYLGYISMTLESALLYTVFVIVALVVFVLNSPLETVFFPVLSTVQVIAPSLIIYRIARGISLETELGTDASGGPRFAVSLPQSVMRSIHVQVHGLNGTAHASLGEHINLDVFAQQPVKEDSVV